MSREPFGELLSRPRPVTWLFTGDSITQGAVHTRGHRDYTQLFKERLGELGRNEDVVINTAVGGKTVTWCAQEVHDRVLRFEPQAVFCMFGTNDSAAGGEGLSGFTHAYERLIGALRGASIMALVLQTPTPIFPLDIDRHWGIQSAGLPPEKRKAFLNRLAHLDSYAAEVRRLADTHGLPLIDHDAIWRQKYGASLGGLLDGSMHPNEYGHRLVCEAILRSLGMWSDKSFTCRLFVPVPL
jgi:acyl-CoA thioesterase I